MGKQFAGLDIGTSACKAAVFDEDGTVLAQSSRTYPVSYPGSGWAEQDPHDWWRAVQETVRAVLAKSRAASAAIRSVGISGQMHGLGMLDAQGHVQRNAILWCDGRTQKQCDEITAKLGMEKLLNIAANPALPGFTAGKILWVREN